MRNNKGKGSSYKEERKRILAALKEADPSSDDYATLQSRLRSLEEADNIRKTRGLTADTILKVAANVALTAGLVLVESKVPLSSTLVKLLPRVPH